jgi:hypothetical protein
VFGVWCLVFGVWCLVFDVTLRSWNDGRSNVLRYKMP